MTFHGACLVDLVGHAHALTVDPCFVIAALLLLDSGSIAALLLPALGLGWHSDHLAPSTWCTTLHADPNNSQSELLSVGTLGSLDGAISRAAHVFSCVADKDEADWNQLVLLGGRPGVEELSEDEDEDEGNAGEVEATDRGEGPSSSDGE
jgi:hypothetical protein